MDRRFLGASPILRFYLTKRMPTCRPSCFLTQRIPPPYTTELEEVTRRAPDIAKHNVKVSQCGQELVISRLGVLNSKINRAVN